MDLELTGTVADFRSPATGRLSGTVNIPSLSVWSSVLNLPSELSGPFTGTVSLTGEGTGADLMVSSQSDLFSLDIGGRLEPGESMLGSTMRMRGQISRPERFLSLFMEDAPALPPAAFEGQFAIEDADTALLSGLQVALGEDAITANGLLGWDTKKHDTLVQLSVNSPNLNSTLSPWLDAPEVISLPARRDYGGTGLSDIKAIRDSAGSDIRTGRHWPIHWQRHPAGREPLSVWQLATVCSGITATPDTD